VRIVRLTFAIGFFWAVLDAIGAALFLILEVPRLGATLWLTTPQPYPWSRSWEWPTGSAVVLIVVTVVVLFAVLLAPRRLFDAGGRSLIVVVVAVGICTLIVASETLSAITQLGYTGPLVDQTADQLIGNWDIPIFAIPILALLTTALAPRVTTLGA
jgi:hypothetical protein